MRRTGVAVMLAAFVLFVAVWLREAWVASSCRERGGSFNDGTGQCDFLTSHARTPFVGRHGALGVASLVALGLGFLLFRRGRVEHAGPSRRDSFAGIRATRFCVGLALLAIALGAVTIAGVPSFREIGGKQGQVFWMAAIILVVDLLLLAVALRASRGVAIAAAFLFALVLVLFAAFGILGGYLAYGLSSGEMPISFMAGWVAGFALMAAAQWLCLFAAYERI